MAPAVVELLICEMGVITPPLGVNVFVIEGIAPAIPPGDIFEGSFPFLCAVILLCVVAPFVPEIATFPPNLVTK